MAATVMSAAVAACQAGDDDAAEGNNAADDGCEDATDTGNDSHDAATNSLEDALDTGDDSTHLDCGLEIVLGLVVSVVMICMEEPKVEGYVG